MARATVSAIAAIGKKRELGKDNRLIWRIPDDLKRFKKLTEGHPVIMGRKTFESIVGYLGKPLPRRINIVLTRDKDWNFDGVVVVHSIEDAIETACALDKNNVFVIGGEQIYKAAFPYLDRLNLTIVEATEDADSFFPPYEKIFTKKMYEEKRTSDDISYRWVDLEK